MADRDFRLYEALRWEPTGGYFLLAEHLGRLAKSAGLFGFRVDLDRVAASLLDHTARLSAPSKVRLEVDARGGILIEDAPLKPADPVTVALAPVPVRRDDLFLRHKTSRREVYEAARRDCPSADDVMLHNERGELTETTTGNLVLALGGHQLTPDLDAGMLPGVYRQYLIERGHITSARLTTADLRRATCIWTINSVRGRCPARLVFPGRPRDPGDPGDRRDT